MNNLKILECATNPKYGTYALKNATHNMAEQFKSPETSIRNHR